ncbi:MAG: RES domain-containing protein [Gallionella sp.]|nr:RES domain-containing protein [Gallionella sp.]
MLFDSDIKIDEIKNKRLCFNCVGEDFISRDIQANGKRKKCSYCNKVGKTYSIGEMSEKIEEAFDEHYVRTSAQPFPFQQAMLADRESNYDWERDGEDVVHAIMNAADIPEEAASDIQQVLDDQFSDFESATMGEETEFSLGSYYEEKGTDDLNWQMEWRQLEESLKSQARFFNHSAAKHLATIFGGIETMCTRDGCPLIIDAGPGTPFPDIYRARAFQSDESLKIALQRPDQHIGPPPSVHASAGRMNAKGISVFYGANDPEVALAEVRPPVGSQVVVARFDILRPIRLLDLTALDKVTSKQGSIFDSDYSHHLEKAMFLRSLSRRIRKPVMPDDEAFEYLPTQAIADFLANEGTTNIDGIIFPSVQSDGKSLNVALFHKAARVAEIDLPAGAKVNASLGTIGENGWDAGYSVIEWVPHEKDKSEKKEQLHDLGYFDSDCFDLDDIEVLGDLNCGIRKKTLKIDLESIKVHVIKAVEFTTEKHPVSRHRWKKHEHEF